MIRDATCVGITREYDPMLDWIALVQIHTNASRRGVVASGNVKKVFGSRRTRANWAVPIKKSNVKKRSLEKTYVV